MRALVKIGGEDTVIELREIDAVERFGRPFRYELEALSTTPIAAEKILDKACNLLLEGATDSRGLAGIVTRVTRIATSQSAPARRYRLIFEPQLVRLARMRRSRVFREQSLPEIVVSLLASAGIATSDIEVRTTENHPKRPYVTQIDETDLDFLQRLCEEAGIHYLFDFVVESSGVRAKMTLHDISTNRTSTGSPLVVGDERGLDAPGFHAAHVRLVGRRRVGKVTVADYAHEKPDVALRETKTMGSAHEQTTEEYLAPAGFERSADGALVAQRRLEALRLEGAVVELQTNAFWLSAGAAVDLEPAPAGESVTLSGPHVVLELRHRWSAREPDRHRLDVRAVPKSTQLRLPMVTPRPTIAGLDVAIVTGPSGSEIHPDSLGRVRLHFYWDLDGPTDEHASLPIRVFQPQMPGSMNIPRVGWEELVAFEDGDPDRPYVVGRTYTAISPPPFSLPKNQQVSALRSASSPGGGGMNSIHMDDAAGGQHFHIQAASAKTLTVAASATISTQKKEEEFAGSQTRSVGGNEATSVVSAMQTTAASQTLLVGATHKVYTGGNLTVTVGGEIVVIGGALLEKVGNPAQGAANLGVQAVLAVPGAVGGVVGGVGGLVGGIAGGLGGAGYAAVQAYEHGGAGAAAAAFGSGVLDMGAGFLPGAPAVLGGLKHANGDRYPWEPAPSASGPAAEGGGAGAGAGGRGGPAGPGPGHKLEKVKGAYSELVGAALIVATPGKIVWETQGGEVLAVAASHRVRALMANKNVGGYSNETSGSFHVTAGKAAARTATASVTTTVEAAHTLKATAGKATFAAGGTMTLKATSLDLKGGAITFDAKGTIVSFSSAGILIKAGSIEITGDSEVTGPMAH